MQVQVSGVARLAAGRGRGLDHAALLDDVDLAPVFGVEERVVALPPHERAPLADVGVEHVEAVATDQILEEHERRHGAPIGPEASIALGVEGGALEIVLPADG